MIVILIISGSLLAYALIGGLVFRFMRDRVRRLGLVDLGPDHDGFVATFWALFGLVWLVSLPFRAAFRLGAGDR